MRKLFPDHARRVTNPSRRSRGGAPEDALPAGLSRGNLARIMTVFGALVLIVSASTSASIGAREYPAPYDAAGQVEVLDQLIETTGGRYRLWPVDLFEEERLYRARANSTMLSDVRFLHKTPRRSGLSARERSHSKPPAARGWKRGTGSTGFSTVAFRTHFV